MPMQRPTRRLAPTRLAALVSLVLATAAAPVLAQEASTLDTVKVTTGTRGQTRTVADSPAPIDVVSPEQLQSVGRDGLQEALNALLPSFNLPAMTGGGTGGVVRAAGLRGLNADQVLILVNGKRRHGSALIQTGWTSGGATPADLSLIPTSAIDHIEVLRDGAAAQYGSDAIAGVINIILKSDAEGGAAMASWGQNYEGDGLTRQQSVDFGLPVGNGGSLHIAAENRDQSDFTRSEDAVRYGFSQTGATVPVATELINYGYGNPETHIKNLSYNLDLPLTDNFSLYSFTTVSNRQGWKRGNFRQATANGNLTEIFPEGSSPLIGLSENDYQAAVGIKGSVFGWDVDASTSYSSDKVRLLSKNNLNPSLGPDGQTFFYMGNQNFRQVTTNLDFTRAFETGLAKPTQVSWGLEQRHESWGLSAGEEASYVAGDYVYTSGPFAGQRPNRSTGVRGVSPDDANSGSRDVAAGYLDVAFNPTDKWYAAIALRHERYDDSAGNTTNGKLTTRYDFTPTFAVRATASTGFRAPSLAQNVYQASSVSAYQATTDGYVQYYYKQLAPGSALAAQLGATELKPEKSKNYSVGFSWTPLSNASLTVDAYRIDIDDRIVLSNILTGASVVALLESAGLRDFNGAQFYTNAVDTKTQGVDAVGEWRTDFGEFGRVRWSLAYNYNETSIEAIHQSFVAGTNYEVFGHSAQGYLTRGNPRDKIIAGADWNIGGFNTSLRATRYGSVVQPGSTAATDREFGKKWIADASVTYNFMNGFSVSVGANNLFDTYPDKNGIVSNTGLGAYGYISPFGFGGGYYYTRLAYNF